MNIIVDSTFNPFSYKDLMQPLLDYKQDYERVEAQYADLVTQTEAWKDIANRENSPEAYAMYKSYSDQLNAIVDDFSQGMNPRNRRQLLNMKRRYASDITPIAKASETMKAANAFRDQVGPDAIFEKTRYNSIDDFLKGETANNRYISKKDITARTAALTQAVAQSVLNDPIIKKSMNPQFLEVIQKKGIGSLQELQAAIAGNAAAANRFAQIKSQVENQLGGIDKFDSEGQAGIDDAINTGLYVGLNNYAVDLQKNAAYESAAASYAARTKAATAEDKLKREMGLLPSAVDKDGNLVYQNSIGERWKVNKDTKAITELPSVNPKTGKLTTDNSDSDSESKGKKLGYTLSAGFPLQEGSAYIEGSSEAIDPDKLDYSKLVPMHKGYQQLHSYEKSYAETIPEVKEHPEDFNYFYAYFNEKGEQCSKSEAVSRRLIISDK